MLELTSELMLDGGQGTFQITCEIIDWSIALWDWIRNFPSLSSIAISFPGRIPLHFVNYVDNELHEIARQFTRACY